ncbi:hypothetical protein EVAR_51805_1 [Eumeta japonica]|uniref:Uncharacterized protein n=1 Tax=Eumeta variegata TaxID=151549 RepID=A0A4C1XVZ4_EUMVA|nr:hypothetical protein EVAR_51805_1 [Eumeta japonica]
MPHWNRDGTCPSALPLYPAPAVQFRFLRVIGRRGFTGNTSNKWPALTWRDVQMRTWNAEVGTGSRTCRNGGILWQKKAGMAARLLEVVAARNALTAVGVRLHAVLNTYSMEANTSAIIQIYHSMFVEDMSVILAGKALLTPLGLRMPMGSGDHLLFGGAHVTLKRYKNEKKRAQISCFTLPSDCAVQQKDVSAMKIRSFADAL